MDQPLTTIVVVPRERFGFAIKSLESLFENTEPPFHLVYVDAGSPNHIKRRLVQWAERRDFTLVRCEKYLTPNQARNVALEFVDSKFIAFTDNDVVYAAKWLSALERCAEETGADIVVPLTCIGEPYHSTVHQAGAGASIVEDNGKRLFRQSLHKFADQSVSQIRHQLFRERTETGEFHTMFVRTSVFDDCGKLDENNMSNLEHVDLCMTVRSKGGEVIFEPNSVITYVPERLRCRELPFFMLRWSDRWTRHTHEQFLQKWHAEEGKPHYTIVDFGRQYRGLGMPRMRKRAVDLFGWSIGTRIIVLVESGLAMWANLTFTGLGKPPKIKLVHAGNGFAKLSLPTKNLCQQCVEANHTAPRQDVNAGN